MAIQSLLSKKTTIDLDLGLQISFIPNLSHHNGSIEPTIKGKILLPYHHKHPHIIYIIHCNIVHGQLKGTMANLELVGNDHLHHIIPRTHDDPFKNKLEKLDFERKKPKKRVPPLRG